MGSFLIALEMSVRSLILYYVINFVFDEGFKLTNNFVCSKQMGRVICCSF
jgi:hypothetical protein